MINFQLALSLIATLIGIIAYFPYIRDIFLLKTKPHAFTWLIWAITQGTAVIGIWYGGGGIGGLNLAAGTILVIAVFLISLKHGTKNVTKSDWIVMCLAILAILVWWQFHQPVVSVIMVSAIDFIGYFPSFRKTYQEPWSETQLSWLLFGLSNVFALFALREYNFLTMSYLITLTAANFALFAICLYRRKFISRP